MQCTGPIGAKLPLSKYELAVSGISIYYWGTTGVMVPLGVPNHHRGPNYGVSVVILH